MYKKPFYITNPVGNNEFSFEERKNKEIYVPALIEGNFGDVEIGDKPSFIEIDDKGEEQVYHGLKNFVKTTWQNVPVYIFDNHNHAFYFWHEALVKGIIKKGTALVHIDEHNDTREPIEFTIDNGQLTVDSEIKIPNLVSRSFLRKIFNYTNFVLNVGNYIVPAIKNGLTCEVIRITGENDLLNWKGKSLNKDYILNLDLDFFSPELEYIDFELKKKVILDFAKDAKLITIATSPYFIDQKIAIDVLKGVFTT